MDVGVEEDLRLVLVDIGVVGDLVDVHRASFERVTDRLTGGHEAWIRGRQRVHGGDRLGVGVVVAERASTESVGVQPVLIEGLEIVHRDRDLETGRPEFLSSLLLRRELDQIPLQGGSAGARLGGVLRQSQQVGFALRPDLEKLGRLDRAGDETRGNCGWDGQMALQWEQLHATSLLEPIRTGPGRMCAGATRVTCWPLRPNAGIGMLKRVRFCCLRDRSIGA